MKRKCKERREWREYRPNYSMTRVGESAERLNARGKGETSDYFFSSGGPAFREPLRVPARSVWWRRQFKSFGAAAGPFILPPPRPPRPKRSQYCAKILADLSQMFSI